VTPSLPAPYEHQAEDCVAPIEAMPPKLCMACCNCTKIAWRSCDTSSASILPGAAGQVCTSVMTSLSVKNEVFLHFFAFFALNCHKHQKRSRNCDFTSKNDRKCHLSGWCLTTVGLVNMRPDALMEAITCALRIAPRDLMGIYEPKFCSGPGQDCAPDPVRR
jgi:hypothetical protein